MRNKFGRDVVKNSTAAEHGPSTHAAQDARRRPSRVTTGTSTSLHQRSRLRGTTAEGTRAGCLRLPKQEKKDLVLVPASRTPVRLDRRPYPSRPPLHLGRQAPRPRLQLGRRSPFPIPCSSPCPAPASRGCPRGRLLMEAQAAVFGQIWPGTSPIGGGVRVGRRPWWCTVVVGHGGVRRSAPVCFLHSIPPQPDRLRPATRIAHTSTALPRGPHETGSRHPPSRRPQSTAPESHRTCLRTRSRPHRPLHAASLLPSRRWRSMAARFGAQEAAEERGGARSPGPAAGEPRWAVATCGR
jgi:hypothetical protein